MRSIRFDFLKSLALISIILAHTAIPPWLFQLRNFDVPLLILVSGAVYGLSKKSSMSYPGYLKKRIPRILLPAWGFLFLFFLSFLFLNMLTHMGPSFSPKTVIDSMLFLPSGEAITGMWIFRIFIMLALLNPILWKITRTKRKTAVFVGVFAVLGINDIWVHSYILSYGCIAAIGMALSSLKTRTVFGIMILFFAIYMATTVTKSPLTFWTQGDKYPPGLHYLSYALFVTLSLYIISPVIQKAPAGFRSFITFTARHSLEIYLWHIYVLYLITWFLPVTLHWLPMALVTGVTSWLITYVIQRVKKMTI